MTVDFGRVSYRRGADFRGALPVRSNLKITRRFSMRLGDSDFQGALDCGKPIPGAELCEPDWTLRCDDRVSGTSTAPMRRTRHERVLNALVDSIQRSGDGAAPETAWHVVSIPEEHLFLSRALGTTEKGLPASGFAGETKTFVRPGWSCV